MADISHPILYSTTHNSFTTTPSVFRSASFNQTKPDFLNSAKHLHTNMPTHISASNNINIKTCPSYRPSHWGKKRTINVILQKTALKPKHKHTDTNTC